MQSKRGPVFKSKNTLSRDELADLFETFADRIRQGRITLSRGGQSVEVALPEGCRVDVQVKDKAKRNRNEIERELELEIHWNVDESGKPTENQAPKRGFSIT